MSEETEWVFTRAEAIKKSKMGASAFDEAVKRRDFPSLKIGRRVLIPARAFERILTGEKA